jgi:hypothetical protein
MEGIVITLEDLKSEKNDGWFIKIERLENRNPILKSAYFIKRGSEQKILDLLKIFFEQENAKYE